MCVDQHYNMQFCVRQLVFLYNILVPHTNFNKPKPTFQAVKGKTGLTLLEKLYWKQRKYIILHTEEHRVRCYLNALWRWGPSGKKCNQHTFANTWGWQWKGQWKYESPYIEIKLDDYSLPTWKMFGIPQNMWNCTSFAHTNFRTNTQNIPHPWAAVYTVPWTTSVFWKFISALLQP